VWEVIQKNCRTIGSISLAQQPFKAKSLQYSKNIIFGAFFSNQAIFTSLNVPKSLKTPQITEIWLPLSSVLV